MDPVVLAAGTALVGAMATDAWQQARAAAVAWWRQSRGEPADEVAAALDADRDRLRAARAAGDEAAELALVGAWRSHLQHALTGNPEAAVGLRRLLADLEPLVEPLAAADGRPGATLLHAVAGDDARVYQAAGDQHITGA